MQSLTFIGSKAIHLSNPTLSLLNSDRFWKYLIRSPAHPENIKARDSGVETIAKHLTYHNLDMTHTAMKCIIDRLHNLGYDEFSTALKACKGILHDDQPADLVEQHIDTICLAIKENKTYVKATDSALYWLARLASQSRSVKAALRELKLDQANSWMSIWIENHSSKLICQQSEKMFKATLDDMPPQRIRSMEEFGESKKKSSLRKTWQQLFR